MSQRSGYQEFIKVYPGAPGIHRGRTLSRTTRSYSLFTRTVRARHAVPLQCKTNPISSRWRLAPIATPHREKRTQYAKQTQFPAETPNLPPHEQNAQNEPNSTRPTANSQKPRNAKRTQSSYGHGPGAPGCPNYAKQTQFPLSRWLPHPQLCKTNPIYHHRCPTIH